MKIEPKTLSDQILDFYARAGQYKLACQRERLIDNMDKYIIVINNAGALLPSYLVWAYNIARKAHLLEQREILDYELAQIQADFWLNLKGENNGEEKNK